MTQMLSCAAGCGREVADFDAASSAGWSLLPIQNRWRCCDCTMELIKASGGRVFDDRNPVVTYEPLPPLDWSAK
jgi:hypothetical protein